MTEPCGKCGLPLYPGARSSYFKQGTYRHRLCPKRKLRRGKKRYKRSRTGEDAFRTRLSREAGYFLDKRSFWNRDGHENRFGIDRSARRHELFVKCEGRCAVCGAFAPEQGQPGFHGELHHTRCYCMPETSCVHPIDWRCGQLVRPCHHHRTAGFVKRVTGEAGKGGTE